MHKKTVATHTTYSELQALFKTTLKTALEQNLRQMLSEKLQLSDHKIDALMDQIHEPKFFVEAKMGIYQNMNLPADLKQRLLQKEGLFLLDPNNSDLRLLMAMIQNSIKKDISFNTASSKINFVPQVHKDAARPSNDILVITLISDTVPVEKRDQLCTAFYWFPEFQPDLDTITEGSRRLQDKIITIINDITEEVVEAFIKGHPEAKLNNKEGYLASIPGNFYHHSPDGPVAERYLDIPGIRRHFVFDIEN